MWVFNMIFTSSLCNANNLMLVKLTSRRLCALPYKYIVKLAEADLGRKDFGEKIRDVSIFLIPKPETEKTIALHQGMLLHLGNLY